MLPVMNKAAITISSAAKPPKIRSLHDLLIKISLPIASPAPADRGSSKAVVSHRIFLCMDSLFLISNAKLEGRFRAGNTYNLVKKS